MNRFKMDREPAGRTLPQGQPSGFAPRMSQGRMAESRQPGILPAQMRQGIARLEAERTAQRIHAEMQAEMQETFEAVLPRIAELVGEGFERKAFREEMAEYLLKSGVPMEALRAMSRGYELELCTKAMLFDKMQKRRAEAEAKLADVPAVLSPRRSGREEGDRLGRARAALNKNPNSTEALAALFAAM